MIGALAARNNLRVKNARQPASTANPRNMQKQATLPTELP